MGTTALRQLLKSLCSNSLWKYGVFWKLNHQTDLSLSWEDGYCHQSKPREAVVPATGNVYFGEANQISFENRSTSIYDCGSAGYPIGLAVADMSHLQYTFGKGVVGEVASTGNHSWVCLDGFCNRESDSNLAPDCPDEWLLQFALGVKTILLVPVFPYGVLQFGSLEMVAEDLSVVAFVKDRFNSMHNVGGTTVSYNMYGSIQAPYLWPQSSGLMENTYESSANGINPIKVENSEDIGSIQQNDDLLSTFFVEFPAIEDSLFGIDASDVFKNTGKCEIVDPETCHIGESNTSSQSIDTGLMDMVENQIFGFSCVEGELFDSSQNGVYNLGVLGESFSGFSSYTAGSASEQLLKINDVLDLSHNSLKNYFEFPKTGELHKTLGTGFQRQANQQLWNPSIFTDTCSTSGLRKDIISSTSLPWLSKTSDAENLLEASVAKDDSSSSISDGVKSCTTSAKFSASYKPLKYEESSPVECEPVTWSQNSALLASRKTSSLTGMQKTSSSFTGMMSNLVDNKHQDKGFTPKQLKKDQKSPGSNGRRAKPGNSPKLRPRDRQLIQDRVKELRELVPNGAQCSIDGLLDRTIKHMMYLRSMTDQAEKLKSYEQQDQEVPRSNNSSETESGFSSGTSRAFELGSESQTNPIVVEDLGHPGHILIEMLCDEHGLFLEIAQAIRRLELTVVKGVMESRSNNLWAHFIVEAPRGFHRMDVFWPLLHLLQRRRNSISSKI